MESGFIIIILMLIAVFSAGILIVNFPVDNILITQMIAVVPILAIGGVIFVAVKG